MAKYEIKFSCGHTETIQLYGKMKDRQRKIEYFEREGLCSECYKKALAQEKESKEKVIDSYIESVIGQLPKLVGSEKQVAWANKLRKEMIADALQVKEETKSQLKSEKLYDDVIAYNFSTISDAKFYIDNRNDSFRYSVLKIFVENFKKIQEEVKKTEKEEADAKQESALKPSETKHDGMVEVTAKNDCVEVRYRNDDDFKDVVKGLKFRWSREGVCWYKEKSAVTFSVVDMAAEVINCLLSAGFVVFCTNDEAKRKAVSGDFNPTTDRWVCKQGNELSISFDRNDDIYNAARKIKYAKYRNGSIRVPVDQYLEVEDFAKSFNFQFSDGAKELIAEYKRKIENADVVTPASVEKPKDEIAGPENIDLSDLQDD